MQSVNLNGNLPGQPVACHRGKFRILMASKSLKHGNFSQNTIY
ncbi:unknown protein [Cronobacter turicensis z3032]|uniref:Uncharacterized protein n=1 Tax=Cronobacter turicensis (strain DSM 18703 / CCUG 55852 / LMG 23827 / z3032) TaxID=693216 RepID=C9Y0C9_CROTZ|nr:unknown protein [Cronobacter turicensis z3032]CCJ89808.1 FIG00554118: hypothetical protein [Cronobacter turicensis 564]CCK03808.1 FIG00554118: hypothetical protein [Cronobacter sakazakii 701]